MNTTTTEPTDDERAIAHTVYDSVRADPPADMAELVEYVHNVAAMCLTTSELVAHALNSGEETAAAYRAGVRAVVAPLDGLLTAVREHLQGVADLNAQTRRALGDPPSAADDGDPTPPHGTERPAISPESPSGGSGGELEPLSVVEARGARCVLVPIPETDSTWYLFSNPELVVRVVWANANVVAYRDARVEGLNREQRRSLPPSATAEQTQPLLTFLAAATPTPTTNPEETPS